MLFYPLYYRSPINGCVINIDDKLIYQIEFHVKLKVKIIRNIKNFVLEGCVK